MKAQIRQEFISGLKSKNETGSNKTEYFDFRERLACSLIFHFLKRRSFNNTMSVFVAECGLGQRSSILSEDDIVQCSKFNIVSITYKQLHSSSNAHEKNATINSELLGELQRKYKDSLFDVLVNFSFSMSDEKSKDIATQTQIAGPGVRESLDIQLSQLRLSRPLNHIYFYFDVIKISLNVCFLEEILSNTHCRKVAHRTNRSRKECSLSRGIVKNVCDEILRCR